MQRGLFEHPNAQTRFAGAGHTRDDRMRGQIGGVVCHLFVDYSLFSGVINASKIEVRVGHKNLQNLHLLLKEKSEGK